MKWKDKDIGRTGEKKMGKIVIDKESHKKIALAKLNTFIDNLDDKKASVFCYWLEDYIKFLNYEDSFQPAKLKKYKRGEIVKAHLGYNIGSEEGGLHYCVVLDNNNSKNSPTITVAPMTSVKKGKDLTKLYPSELHIGSELYDLMHLKISTTQKEIDNTIELLKATHKNKKLTSDSPEIANLLSKHSKWEKAIDEITKMKFGSIILLGQITTISKIRIYDPKRNDDPLGKIRLSNTTLNLIDKRIESLYFKPKHNI